MLPVRIYLENKSGRKQRMVAWNYHDEETFFIDNISASRINRRLLSEIIDSHKVCKDGYAQLKMWEFLNKMMPGWEIFVTSNGGCPFWSNQNVESSEAS